MKKHYLYYERFIIDKKLKKICIIHCAFIKRTIDILNSFCFLYLILNYIEYLFSLNKVE